MRVALVTHQFFPAYYTGVERATLNVAKQLGRVGHECVVLTAAERSSGDERPYGWEGVRVRPIPGSGDSSLEPWRTRSKLAARIGRVLDEERVEVVDVVQPARLPEVFGEARRRGLPVVARVPDFTYVCPRQNLVQADGSPCPGPDGGHRCAAACRVTAGPTYGAWGAAQLDAAAAVVCPSRATIAFHAEQGQRVEHWVRIPWGVDYASGRRLPAPPGDGLRIGFVGTLLRHKGPHVLLEAIGLLRGRNVRAVVYGESFHERAYEQELRRLAADEPRIGFGGPYEQRELASLLERLDLVAIPSLWRENLPLVGLNAAAGGVPVVVSDVPGLRELVDEHDCGFTFPAGDAEALAALLQRLLDDPELLQEVRARMLCPVGIEEEAWLLEALYADVVGRGRNGSRAAERLTCL